MSNKAEELRIKDRAKPLTHEEVVDLIDRLDNALREIDDLRKTFKGQSTQLNSLIVENEGLEATLTVLQAQVDSIPLQRDEARADLIEQHENDQQAISALSGALAGALLHRWTVDKIEEDPDTALDRQFYMGVYRKWKNV